MTRLKIAMDAKTIQAVRIRAKLEGTTVVAKVEEFLLDYIRTGCAVKGDVDVNRGGCSNIEKPPNTASDLLR